ncbi:superoxide dismutase [Mn]-like [Uloborus diversus]|uniref:superoxide dismutase [Mn]-like n=1 Tax=Uloborus diversus TaxID=327109 RepID=UPI0024099931|nr:superoxide dismutase [Mn]-like [Uloborus diversus]
MYVSDTSTYFRIFTWSTILIELTNFACCSKIAPAFYGLERPALEYELPPLLYSFDELEPYFDEATVRMHYLEFHSKYVNEVNRLLKRWRRHTLKGKQMSRMSIIDIIRNLSHIPPQYRNELKNYGSGLVNHNLYWATISPNPQGEHRIPVGHIATAIDAKFGSYLEFKSTFTDMATNYFGSGFVWLCRNYSTTASSGDLVVIITENEDSPVSNSLFPILGLDLWEHAYLTKFRNQKLKYIENWWFLVDWHQVNNLANWWIGLKFHDEL